MVNSTKVQKDKPKVFGLTGAGWLTQFVMDLEKKICIFTGKKLTSGIADLNQKEKIRLKIYKKKIGQKIHKKKIIFWQKTFKGLNCTYKRRYVNSKLGKKD